MNATVSADGTVQIPKELRESAQIKAGDTLEVCLYKGTLVLRKHAPLNPEEVAALLERSRSLPKPTPADDDAVAQVIRDVRTRR